MLNSAVPIDRRDDRNVPFAARAPQICMAKGPSPSTARKMAK